MTTSVTARITGIAEGCETVGQGRPGGTGGGGWRRGRDSLPPVVRDGGRGAGLAVGAAASAAAPTAAPGGAPGGAPSGVLGRALRRVAATATTAAVVLAVAAFLFLGVGPHLLGYRTATMLTGSMAPGIAPGDVIVSVPKAAEDVAVGDVLSYQIPVEDHRVETHRVVKVARDPAGRVSIVTKGDANNGVDPWVATLEGDTVWQTRLVVPRLGSMIRVLREPLVQRYVFWTALPALVALLMWQIWRPRGRGGTS